MVREEAEPNGNKILLSGYLLSPLFVPCTITQRKYGIGRKKREKNGQNLCVSRTDALLLDSIPVHPAFCSGYFGDGGASHELFVWAGLKPRSSQSQLPM
jgi:hypothetical protein